MNQAAGGLLLEIEQGWHWATPDEWRSATLVLFPLGAGGTTSSRRWYGRRNCRTYHRCSHPSPAARYRSSMKAVEEQWTVQHVLQSTGAHELEGPTRTVLLLLNNVNI